MINRHIAPDITELSNPVLLKHSINKLANGIEIIITNDPNQEVFKMDVVYNTGTINQSKALIANTTMNMLCNGTTKHNSNKIAEIFDYYGSYIDTNCGFAHSELSMIAPTKYAKNTIPLLGEMIQESIFPEKEIEIFLRNKYQEFLLQQEKTSYMVLKKFSQLMFGENNVYTNPVNKEDFKNISRDILKNYYNSNIQHSRCKIYLSGCINNEIIKIINNVFSYHCLDNSNPNKKIVLSPAEFGTYSVNKKDAVQSSIRIGKKGVQLVDNEYPEFQVLNTILGGYFGSRLMNTIREEKGYTYGINSLNVSLPDTAYWCIVTDVDNKYVEDTIYLINKEIEKLKTTLVGDDELKNVKRYMHGSILREIDGVFSQSDTLKNKQKFGLDNTIYNEIIEKVKKCTSEKLLYLANKHLSTDAMYIVKTEEITE